MLRWVQLRRAVAIKERITPDVIESVLGTAVSLIADELERGGAVYFRGLGTIFVRTYYNKNTKIMRPPRIMIKVSARMLQRVRENLHVAPDVLLGGSAASRIHSSQRAKRLGGEDCVARKQKRRQRSGGSGPQPGPLPDSEDDMAEIFDEEMGAVGTRCSGEPPRLPSNPE